MIGYRPHHGISDIAFGTPLGRCRFVALPFGRPVLYRRTYPRIRLGLRFGEPELSAWPVAAPVMPQQMLHDGLGNPLGIFPFIPAIASIAAKVLPLAAKVLPSILPAPTPGAPAPPTVASPTVQAVVPGPIPPLPFPPLPIPPLPIAPFLRRRCPPPTMEECRRLYPPPAPVVPTPLRRRRPRIVRLRQR
jgi:hypothetical protein